MSAVSEKADEKRGDAGLGGEPFGKRDSGAFLVRVWREPTNPDGTEGLVRCYMKNLKTGEEHYVTTASALASQVLAQMEGKRAGGGPPSGNNAPKETPS